MNIFVDPVSDKHHGRDTSTTGTTPAPLRRAPQKRVNATPLLPSIPASPSAAHHPPATVSQSTFPAGTPLAARKRADLAAVLRPLDSNLDRATLRRALIEREKQRQKERNAASPLTTSPPTALDADTTIDVIHTTTTTTTNGPARLLPRGDMSLLTERQKEELHLSLLDYLHAAGLHGAYDALRQELGMETYVPDPKARTAGLLEKKWGSVIRLQKKIMDLESKNATLTEELAAAPSARRSASQADWIPRAPARHMLTGHRGPINRVAFHPVHSVVATASEDATVKLWDWETGEFERTLKGHTKAVQDADFDSKGSKLVTCSSDLSIKIWDCENDYKNIKNLVDHDHAVSSARFMPGDDFIVSASRDRSIKMWDVARGFCVRTFHGHAEWVRLVVPSEDGRLLASCSNDQTARIWDPTSGEVKAELRGHEHVLESLTFAPAASYAAIRELCSLTGPAPKGPGAFLATASRDKSIKLWEVSSGQLLRTLVGHDNWVRALVFHPNGKYLLSASDDKTLRVWELKTGRCVRTVEAHTHFVQCLAWGRAKVGGGEGEEKQVNVVATGSVDQSAKIWTP